MFAYCLYRWLDGRNYDYQRMRCCFLLLGLIYCTIFIAAGVVFVILYSNQLDQYQNQTCSEICGQYGATSACGFQQCCRPNNFFISYSYSYCDDNFVTTVYLILFLSCFGYAIFEGIILVSLLCRGEGFRSRARGDVIVMSNNLQQPMQPTPPNSKKSAKHQQKALQQPYSPYNDAYQAEHYNNTGGLQVNNYYHPYPAPDPQNDFMPAPQPYIPPKPYIAPPAYGMLPDPPKVTY